MLWKDKAEKSIAMGHIHTGPGEHDLTASAFIIRETETGPEVLMHKHKKLLRIMQPGGHVELTENPFHAVLREIFEETGYSIEQLYLLQLRTRVGVGNNGFADYRVRPDAQPIHVNTHPIGNDNSHFHTDLAYAFLVQDKPHGKPVEGESTEFYWLGHKDVVDNIAIPSNVRLISEWLLRTCHTMSALWAVNYI